jgi:hypothetical protein
MPKVQALPGARRSIHEVRRLDQQARHLDRAAVCLRAILADGVEGDFSLSPADILELASIAHDEIERLRSTTEGETA